MAFYYVGDEPRPLVHHVHHEHIDHYYNHHGGAGDEGGDQPVHHVDHDHTHFHHHHFTTPPHYEADTQFIEQHLVPILVAADPPGPHVHHYHYFYLQVPLPPPPLNHHQQEQGGAIEGAQENGNHIEDGINYLDGPLVHFYHYVPQVLNHQHHNNQQHGGDQQVLVEEQQEGANIEVAAAEEAQEMATTFKFNNRLIFKLKKMMMVQGMATFKNRETTFKLIKNRATTLKLLVKKMVLQMATMIKMGCNMSHCFSDFRLLQEIRQLNKGAIQEPPPSS